MLFSPVSFSIEEMFDLIILIFSVDLPYFYQKKGVKSKGESRGGGFSILDRALAKQGSSETETGSKEDKREYE